MKITVRNNIEFPYTLHDMNVCGLDVSDDNIIMRTQTGIVEVGDPCRQVEGDVKFYGVQWDFSYVYLLGVNGNVGSFTGEKMYIRDFIDRYKQFGFSIMDETYGYNMTKFCGFLLANRQHCECIIEIYHEGDMVFISEE